MSVTTGTFPGVRIVDMPDLGAVNDASSMVGERAGSGRFAATAFRSYVSSYIAAGLPWINVRDWGAKGDGATDDTAAINAAYAAVPASGAVVLFPQGVYLTSSPILVGRSNTVTEGCNSEIRSTNATSDHFQLATGVNRLVFRDLSLWATVAKTAGAGFKALGVVYDSTWYNVQVGSVSNYQGLGGVHRLNNGYDFTLGLSRVYLDAACVTICAANGIAAAGTGSGGGELTIDGRILFCTVGANILGSLGGVYFNGEISQCGTGVLLSKINTGATNREIFFGERCVIDSCTDYSLHVAASSVVLLDVSGSWFSSAGQLVAGSGVGLFIETAATPYGSAKISGARFFNNKITGLVNAGMECLVSGCMFDVNGAGAIIETLGANGTMIDGCSFQNNTGAGVTIQNGINIFAVTSNLFISNGSTIGGDAVGWAPTRAIRGNTGYASRNCGTATMPSGAASVTFAHGLPNTPQGGILISSNQQNHTFALGTITATSITVNADTALTANASIWWEASMGPNA
jgi:hypothetical protein